MRMQKGLCIELNDEYSIFIGPNGEFVHGTPAREAAVGEESFFYPKQAQAAGVKKRKAIKPVWAPIAAALAIAVLFFSVMLPRQEAFAYVQVQVNPGIELGFDENYEVVSIRELNDDGLELIGELGEWKHHSLEEVLNDVIEMSMTDSTDEIVITTVADSEDDIADEAVENTVMAISSKVMAGNVSVRLKEASKKQWRASVEKSIPVGQLISESKSPKKNQAKEPASTESDQEPLNIKNNQSGADKEKKKDLKSEELEKRKEQIAPVDKQKVAPPGQENRQLTPAAEKGNPNPPGQDKRNEVPKLKNPKDGVRHSDAPAADKGKDPAPGQEKKKDENVSTKSIEKDKEIDEDKNNDAKKDESKDENKDVKKDENKGKDASSKPADNEKKTKPEIVGPQNSKGKNTVKDNDSTPPFNAASENNGKNKGN